MSKEYTADEVSKHNTPEDLWIIIDGNVFDVTEWQKDHPGGKKMLQKVGGKDATKFFHKYHEPAVVMRKFGNKFKIGKLSPNPAVATVSANPTMAKIPRITALPTNGEDGEPLEQFGDMIPYADPMWYQGFHSQHHDESHAALRDRIRSYVDEKISPYIDEWEEADEIPTSVFKEFAEAGWLPYALGSKKFPSEYAENKHADIVPDEKFDPFHESIVGDELSRPGSGALVWYLVGGYSIGIPPVLNFAKDSIKKRVLPDVFSGKKRICLCITEPSGGSDVANLVTEAKLSADGKHYVVNGVKKWITNGMFADFFSVAVRTGGPGMGGISMLLIERTFDGVSTRHIATQGMNASGTALVTFDDVKVPVENLLGEENKGFQIIMRNFNHERLGCITQANRFSRVCYEEAIKWAFQRETFGVKLFKHDVIRNKLAQMACRIEASCALADALVYQSSKMEEDEAMLRLGGNIAGCKAFSTQTFEYCAREASQIFGGLSYTRGGKGGKVERLYRVVRALAIPGGSEEIMLDLSIRQSVKVHQMYGANL